MNDTFLKKLYNNEEHGLKSAGKFYKFIKENYKDIKYTLKEIKEFVEGQKTDQVFKKISNKDR